MRLQLGVLKRLISETSNQNPPRGQVLRKGDIVEIYESYEERRRSQGVRKKSEFVDMTRGIIADVEISDDGCIRVGLKPDPSAEHNIDHPDNDEIFCWAFPSMLRKIQ